MGKKSRALEQAIVEKYLINEYCPTCHCADVEEHGHPFREVGLDEDNEPKMYQPMICRDCGATWREVYHLQRLDLNQDRRQQHRRAYLERLSCSKS
jgi:hypothetical protein